MNVAPRKSGDSTISIPDKWTLGRREFINKSILSLLGLWSLGGGVLMLGNKNANTISIRNEPLSLDGLPAELSGFWILHQTDHHIVEQWNIDQLAQSVWISLQSLIDWVRSDSLVVLQGGDFVCRETRLNNATTVHEVKKTAPHILRGLNKFTNIGVRGNHDISNPDFSGKMQWIFEQEFGIQFLEQPDTKQLMLYNGHTIAVHGFHTDVVYGLEWHDVQKLNEQLDGKIQSLNNGSQILNVVVLHHPDSLQYLLKRLTETGQSLQKETRFFAGHTHGSMVNIPWIRQICLDMCLTKYWRYKWWYWPEWEFAETGKWQMYVSTGLGNSPYMAQRFNAPPEIVCWKFG